MKCINCGNDVSNNDSVCPFCGTSRAVNQNMQQTIESKQSQNTQNYQEQHKGAFCIICGKPIPSGYKMCPECMGKNSRAEVPPKKKRSAVPIILVIVLLVALIAVAGFVAYNNGLFTFVGEFQLDNSEDSLNNEDTAEDTADDNADDDDDSDSPSDNGNSDDEDNGGNSSSGSSSGTSETPKESTYELVVPTFADRIVTWEEAEYGARNAGGHLVSINSQEEFDKITAMADKQGIYMVWVGAKRTAKRSWNDIRWLDGTKMTYTKWLTNEPSYVSEGEEEEYLMILKSGGKWYFNDTYNDISEAYDVSTYSPKTAYIIEKEK